MPSRTDYLPFRPPVEELQQWLRILTARCVAQTSEAAPVVYDSLAVRRSGTEWTYRHDEFEQFLSDYSQIVSGTGAAMMSAKVQWNESGPWGALTLDASEEYTQVRVSAPTRLDVTAIFLPIEQWVGSVEQGERLNYEQVVPVDDGGPTVADRNQHEPSLIARLWAFFNNSIVASIVGGLILAIGIAAAVIFLGVR